MNECKAIYQCTRCGTYLSVDTEPVDTGREKKEVFIQQTIFHDGPYGRTGKAIFMYLTRDEGGR